MPSIVKLTQTISFDPNNYSDQSLVQNDTKLKQIRLTIVENVLDYDFPQAKKTWEALVDAGIDPGSLVANGLASGHGYHLRQESQIAQFAGNDPALVSETKISEDVLMGYSLSQSFPQSGSLKFLSAAPTQSLVKASETNPAIVLIEETEVEDQPLIDFTAIIRANTLQLK